MKKSTKLLVLVAIAAVMLAFGLRLNAVSSNDDMVKVAALVSEMNDLGFAKVDQLAPLAVKPYTLPGPSVDVMRVRLEETYRIQGVGNDTVELNGWIAVRHGASRPAKGETTVSWATAVTDTEFVALELHGQSAVFGPVRISLDKTRPVIGQVGKIDIPERASRILLAANKQQAAQPAPKSGKPAKPIAPDGTCPNECRAPVNVRVSMPTLGLEMKTREPAVWYSEVTTIPPVGQVASVTTDPVSLVSADREVGSLISGMVKFRQVVRSVELSRNHQVQIASLGGSTSR